MFDVLTNNPYKSAILLAKGERANPMEIGIFKYDNGLYLMISIRSFPYRIDNVLHKVSGQPDNIKNLNKQNKHLFHTSSKVFLEFPKSCLSP